ncbi:MAG: helix-turn-helix domain-containing protein [Faecousia sp.]
MSFNKNLLQARKEKGMNQEELANKIGITHQAVSKWETGE